MRLTAIVLLLSAASCRQPVVPVENTVGQIERVRAGVTVGTNPADARDGVASVRRLAPSDVVRTDANGRAVLSLDRGGRFVMDVSTSMRVDSDHDATLDAGRVWIAGGGEGGRLEEVLLHAGGATLHLRGARASVAIADGHADVTVLSGEIAYEHASERGAIVAGRSMTLGGARAAAPVQDRLFRDWTGGLADDLPDGAGEAAGLGAVAARRPDESGAPRWSMVMQRLDAHVVMRGDLAITSIDQTFFNPSSDTVEGLYTFLTPPGAVLQSFGVDRRGRTVEGVVRERQQAAARYQAQVYRGSTHDPALLEWDAPGRYHARLYPIPPGATRRIRVRYTQWLHRDQRGRRVYRLPLASLDTRVGELRADFDLSGAHAQRVRSVIGSRIENQHLYVAQSDVQPRADLVVEMDGPAPRDAVGSRVAAPAGDDRGDLIRVEVLAPVETARTPSDDGVDLVVVVDHSAATDSLAQRLQLAFVESLVGSLSERDHVLVLAGDVGTRAIGSPNAELRPASDAVRRSIVDGLTHDALGGATDLGAMIAAAHHAMRPGRNGAIVYVGDGRVTVGEDQLAALRQLLSRLSPRPRFYAIAVGEDPQLDLLEGISAPSGFAARVARRGDVGRVSMDVLAHVSRPLVRNFHVDLGPNVQSIYPSDAVDLPAGEPLVVIGRVRGSSPANVTVHATWNGTETTRRVALDTTDLDDGGDLRFRWANGRLQALLARGESRAVIVDLGTRYGLITPFTSLYVASEDEVGRNDARNRAETVRLADARGFSLLDLVPLVGCTREHGTEPPAAEPSTAFGPMSGEQANVRSQNAPMSPPQPSPSRGSRRPALGQIGQAETERSAGEPAPPPEAQTGATASPPAVAVAPSVAPAAAATMTPPADEEPQAAAAPSANREAPSEMVANRGIFAAIQQPAGPAGGGSASASGGRADDDGADRSGNGTENGNRIGDAYGYGGLGATGTGWGGGGTGGGTIGLGNIGTMGHGAGTGSGQGYGSGAGVGLRGRGTQGPLVRAAPPAVTGMLSPEVIRRVVLRNLGQVAHCHEQSFVQNANAAGRVVVRFVIGGTGTVLGSDVAQSTHPVPTVAPCIANAVRRWQFPSPEGGGIVTVNYPFNLSSPDGGSGGSGGGGGGSVASATRAANTVSRCSDAAIVPLRERVSLWRERLNSVSGASAVAQVYRNARRTCELPGWSDRVALLRLMVAKVPDVNAQIDLFRGLRSDSGASVWVRNVILRGLARTGELGRAEQLGLGRLDSTTLTTALGGATTPDQRLNVLRELVRRYPDDLDLGMRLLDVAVQLRNVGVVRAQSSSMRANAQADARVRTACGEALLAMGDDADARRAFSEIVEFAPDDPLARRRLGDIAVSHGWADEAYRQFEMLARMENDAPEVLLRQAIAARMAGRLDEAIRLAERVAEQSGSSESGGPSDVAAAWIGVELALAGHAPGVDPETLEALRARWRRSPAARASGAVRIVLRWSHPDDGAELWLALPGEPVRRSDLMAQSVPFETTALPEVPASISLQIRRAASARPSGRAELIIVWNEGTPTERIDVHAIALDDATPRRTFTATVTGLTETTPPPIPPPAAAAAPAVTGARAVRAAGGAR